MLCCGDGDELVAVQYFCLVIHGFCSNHCGTSSLSSSVEVGFMYSIGSAGVSASISSAGSSGAWYVVPGSNAARGIVDGSGVFPDAARACSSVVWFMMFWTSTGVRSESGDRSVGENSSSVVVIRSLIMVRILEYLPFLSLVLVVFPFGLGTRFCGVCSGGSSDAFILECGFCGWFIGASTPWYLTCILSYRAMMRCLILANCVWSTLLRSGKNSSMIMALYSSNMSVSSCSME